LGGAKAKGTQLFSRKGKRKGKGDAAKAKGTQLFSRPPCCHRQKELRPLCFALCFAFVLPFLIPDAAVVIKERDGTFVVKMIEIGSGRQTVNELRNRLRFGVDSLPQRVRDTIKFLDHFITPGPDAG
jgi:hypothetical protein